jgi:predicted transcriptional regulator
MTSKAGLHMLEPILGSTNCERALIFILARSKGYPREISRFFNVDLSPVQQQLDKLESGGVLVSQTAGRTRLYEFNPRYPFLKELKALLDKALSFYPEEEKNRLFMNRRRPRRRGKPQ